jgi:hypothetical protein
MAKDIWDPFNSKLKESTKNKLIKAQEAYLFARGWEKVGEKYYSPNSNVSWVFAGDKVFLKEVLRAQEDYES